MTLTYEHTPYTGPRVWATLRSSDFTRPTMPIYGISKSLRPTAILKKHVRPIAVLKKTRSVIELKLSFWEFFNIDEQNQK